MGKVIKKIFKWGFIGFVGLIILGVIVSIGEDEPVSTNEATETEAKPQEDTKEEPKEEVYNVGQPVQTGDLEYVINSVGEVNEIKSDNQFIESKTTQGKFVVVDYTVKNNDKKARMIDGNLFIVKDADGNEYEPMADADIMMLLGDKNLFLEEVNPNLSRTGTIVFELGSDATGLTLQVSSGIGWSGGEYKSIKLN